jgi:hypothetical protein
MASNLEYALRYRRRGFSIIPCKTNKKPYIKWEPYQLQKPTEDEIKQWWGKWPEANIAIVCGAISGIDVLDVDTQEAYESLNDFHLPESFATPTVKTPKGRHLYFKHRSGLANKVRAVPGTDLRTTGGYVIAPPSRNGDSTPYVWFEGLTPKDLGFSEWPDQLFQVLQQASFSSPYNNNSYSLYSSFKEYINCKSDAKGELQTVTPVTNGDKILSEGQRNSDIFHIANCLIKGGCSQEHTEKVIEILARNCSPPYPESELPAIIRSALDRQKNRDRNLAYEVLEWVSVTSGDFSVTDGYNELQLVTKQEKNNFKQIMKRLCECDPPVIERSGTRNGVYRRIENDCQPVDWLEAECNYIDLWLPLGLGHICGVQPGNILMFAGAKDSGKTAFLMNIAKENRHKYSVHYLNSEMGKQEFKMRMSKFDDVTIEQLHKGIKLYNVSDKFHDKIKCGEGNLNIIDYLESPDEAFKVGPMIRKIHEKLDGAICVIGIQKKINAPLGRGAEFSMEKSRLYIAMDYGRAVITSCKNFKENDIITGNPRGYTCRYKLVNGCKIMRQPPGWVSPIDKEKL